MMPNVLITGGTGVIGQALTRTLLQEGFQVTVLTRQLPGHNGMPGVRYARWDIARSYIEPDAIEKADYIVHLAGAGIADKRWTARRKAEIVNSRTSSSRLIAAYLATKTHRVKAVISSSAIGWYGQDPEVPNPHPFTEMAKPDAGFLGETCRQWEESIEAVSSGGVRLVKLRTGIVLTTEGGALKEFLRPLKWGLATILGNGRQMISWIHIKDLVALYLKAIRDDHWQGAYNAVAPEPVSNKTLILTLARNRKKFFIPVRVPGFALQLVLGEMSVEVLKSATVSSAKAAAGGFQFSYPHLQEAVVNLLAGEK